MKMIRHFVFLFSVLSCVVLGGQPPTDYKKIDRHARRAPADLHQDLPALTSYLVSEASGDHEKARAIYTWITHNITYDEAAYHDGNRRINRNNQDILRRRTAVCFGYAQLFRAMCDQAGLSSEVISGYSKGTLTSLPDMEKADHAWNAVLIKGEWHLLDATWGGSAVQKEPFFAQEGLEQYFLTPPDRFILNHLPSVPMWQLLACPVTPSVFRQSPEEISFYIEQSDSCFSFRDSIDHWRDLPAGERSLATALAAYRFHPTPPNGNELGHAYMDFAGALSDRAETLQEKGQMNELIPVQDSMIAACKKADAYADTLYAWQKELYINVLINQSVALFQSAGEASPDRRPVLLRTESLLEEARKIIRRLSPESLYARQVSRQCDDYLKIVQDELDKK